MAEISAKMRFVLRNDIASNWTLANPVLLKGEMGLETDTNKFKFGDGITTWSELDYAGASMEDMSAAIESYINENILSDGKIKNELLPEGIGSASVYSISKTASVSTDEELIKAKVTELAGSVTFKQGDIFIINANINEEQYILTEVTGYIISSKPATNDAEGVWAAVIAMNGEVDASKVILTKDITMAGKYTQVGNLTKTTTDSTGTFATKGMSVADAFTAIFSKEEYPTTSTSNGDYTLSISAPTVNVPGMTSIMEVGSELTFQAVTAPAQSVNKGNKPTVSGFTYGYKDTIDGVLTNNKTISVDWDVNPQVDAKYSLNISKTGFSETELTNTTAENADNASCTVGENVLKVSLGTNKYTVNVSGPAQTGTAAEIPAKYIVSNLGNTSESYKSQVVASQSKNKSGATNRTEKTITGVYPVFTNAVSNGASANTANADTKLVVNQSVFEIDYGVSKPNRCKFAFPASMGDPTIKLYNSLSGQWDPYAGSPTWETANKTINGTEYSYKTWTDSFEYTDASKYQFTFSKSTSQA